MHVFFHMVNQRIEWDSLCLKTHIYLCIHIYIYIVCIVFHDFLGISQPQDACTCCFGSLFFNESDADLGYPEKNSGAASISRLAQRLKIVEMKMEYHHWHVRLTIPRPPNIRKHGRIRDHSDSFQVKVKTHVQTQFHKHLLPSVNVLHFTMEHHHSHVKQSHFMGHPYYSNDKLS